MIQSITGPKVFEGVFEAPPSKSYAQRALACALISNQLTEIVNFGSSADELNSLQVLKDIGLKIEQNNRNLSIAGQGFNPQKALQIHFGESGLAARMFTPILSNSHFDVQLFGSGSLLNRSMETMATIMQQGEVAFSTNHGKLPFELKGPLQPTNMVIDGSMSSQFITGMILAYVASPLLTKQIIEVKNPKSTPYIELTLDILRQFGVELTWEQNRIEFNGPYQLLPAKISIEGDWSSASFFMVAAALNGRIEIHGLNPKSKQADVRILDALRDFGAEISINENVISVQSKERRAFQFDATNCPDLFPPLSVLASFAHGTSSIKGVSRLYHKESNRAESIQQELGKMGAQIEIVEDCYLIQGISKAQAVQVDSHNDHRIAMATAVMALQAEGTTQIANAQAVNKSFPDFFPTFNKFLVHRD